MAGSFFLVKRMPLPKPKKQEKEKDFISRCMADPVAVRDFKDNKQRAGVCYSQWRKRMPKANANIVTINQAPIQVNQDWREETFEGRQYLIHPVTMLMEGVHEGNGGPLLYRANDIEAATQFWNGVPLCLYHPQDKEGNLVSANSPEMLEQFGVGSVYNSYWDNGLKGEIWTDIEKANKVDPQLVGMIKSPDFELQVSTGLYHGTLGEAGTWNDISYNDEAISHIPDHLSLLPGKEGACSWQDGCGVRANENIVEEKVTAEIPVKVNVTYNHDEEEGEQFAKDFISNFKQSLLIKLKNDGIKINEISHGDLNGKLRTELVRLRKQPNSNTYHYLEETYDDYFIYEVEDEKGSRRYYKQKYTVDSEKDEVIFLDDPIEVKKVTEYKPITDNEKEVIMPDKEEKKCCEELIDSLVANEKTQFTDEDKVWLADMTQDQLEKLVPVVNEKPEEEETKPEAVVDPIVDPTVNQEPDKEPEKVATLEELLANAAPNLKEGIESAVKAHEEKKAKMIDAIVANKRNAFDKADLEGRHIDEITKLIALAHVEPDFSGQAGSTQKVPNMNERQADGSGVPPMPKLSIAK